MTDSSSATSAWTWSELRGSLPRRIGVLRLDVPGREMNVLTLEGLAELDTRLSEVAGRGFEGIIVTSGRPDFLAGADVDLIAAVRSEAEGRDKATLGQRTLGRLASLGIPSVAAIEGSCLGGGAELACWCSGRVASLDDRTRIGFPEILLGIVPGFGGTQRLPRLIGLAPALTLITTGRQAGALEALRLGLVDAVAEPEHLLTESGALVERLLRGMPTRRRHWSSWPLMRDIVTMQARKAVSRATGGKYPAAPEAVRLARLSLTAPAAEGLAEEAGALGLLLSGPVSQSLLHLYHSRREAERAGTAPPPGALVGVLGAGVMGAGIAGVSAAKGFRARLRDLDAAVLARGAAAAQGIASNSRRRAIRKSAAMQAAADRVTWSLALDGLRAADLVVEAIVERADVKKPVLAELESACGERTLLATNTSSLSVDDLAGALKDPSRFVGLHFFNPVDKMPLVEIVRGKSSSVESVARAIGWAKAMGKVPVVVADAPGFVVNRILMPYLDEAFALLRAGHGIADIDAAARAFGMPMGPFRLLDEVGLDVALHVSRTFAAAFPDRFSENALLATMLQQGRLGKKNDKGFYEKKGGKWAPWPGATKAHAPLDRGVAIDRMFSRMANEGLRCLEEGLVTSSRDIDLATVFGIGFPAFHGGLCRWIATERPTKVLARLEAVVDGDEPCQLLRDLAAGKSDILRPSTPRSRDS